MRRLQARTAASGSRFRHAPAAPLVGGDLCARMGGRHIAHARGVAAMVRASGDDRIVAVALLHDVVEKGRIRPAEPLAGTPGWWSSRMC